MAVQTRVLLDGCKITHMYLRMVVQSNTCAFWMVVYHQARVFNYGMLYNQTHVRFNSQLETRREEEREPVVKALSAEHSQISKTVAEENVSLIDII